MNKSLNSRSRRRLKKVAQELVGHAFLLAGSIIFALPFFWMLSTSLKPDHQIFLFPPKWIPSPIDWANYPEAATFVPFLTYLINTLVICVMNVIGVLFSSSFAAYGFSRIRWPGRDVLFTIMLSTMMIPFYVTMIPLFLSYKRFGMLGNTTLGIFSASMPLWVPAFLGVPLFIFLLRQFFMTIPMELSDSAKVDGSSEFGIYWRILLPLAKPALAVVALFTFINVWHDFIGPLIYLSHKTHFTLSLGLAQFKTQYGAEWALMMAASILITMPIVILFFFTQRTFIQGITLTGIKA